MKIKKIMTIKLNYRIVAIFTIAVILSVSLFIYTSVNATEPEGIKVPIIMYHSILKSRTGKYIVSPENLEKDFKYISERGYTTITMTDLIEYVYNDRELPEKPIIITFDDGYYNNYTYLVPLLEKYDMKAVIAIVGEFSDRFSEANEVNANYGHLRWVDIGMLIPEGRVEFQNHSYNLHSNNNGRKGSMKKRGESIEEYKKVLSEDIGRLQKEFQDNCYYTPNTFIYPFGAVSSASIDIIKELGFKASLSVAAGMNYITKDPECLYLLKRYNREGHLNTEKFFNKILD